MLALRLVESGVRLVSVQLGGWDTHGQLHQTEREQSAQTRCGTQRFADRSGTARSLETTAVFVTGEFGRTPKINSRSAEGGRDHYPRCMFMLTAGGAVRGGDW